MSKNLILTIITILVVAIFSGCGNTDEASFEKSGSNTIAIDVNCSSSVSSSTIATYIALQSGDTIVQNEDNTTIETYHDADGNKRVCIVSGSASIVR